jgi:hypothetical protein
LFLLILLLLLGIAVEVHINHDIPGSFSAGNGTAQAKNFACKEPPDETYRVTGLVVCWDGNIDELERRVGIAKSNDGNGNFGAFL